MRTWDDADKWLDLLLLFERMAAVQAFRRRVEDLLKDERATRSAMREAIQRYADELDRTRFTRSHRPKLKRLTKGWQSGTARRCRSGRTIGAVALQTTAPWNRDEGEQTR